MDQFNFAKITYLLVISKVHNTTTYKEKRKTGRVIAFLFQGYMGLCIQLVECDSEGFSQLSEVLGSQGFSVCSSA